MTTQQRLTAAVALADESLLRLDRGSAAPVVADLPLRLDAAWEPAPGRWVTLVSDAAGSRWVVPLVWDGDQVRRARPGDGVAEAIAAAVADDRHPTDLPFSVVSWGGRPVRGERAIGVDQTNDSVVVGGEVVVKWNVHQARVGRALAHPAAARLATLTRAGFDGTPSAWGLVTVDVGEEAPLLVATVMAHLPGAVDGWTWAVEDVRRLATGDLVESAAVQPAGEVGELVARLHLALTSDGEETATPSAAARWAGRAQADLDRAAASVPGPEGERLRALAPRAAEALSSLAEAAGTPLIHVHGDLHVGQVLRYGDPPAYAVVDFDGSPVLPPDERTARRPAAVDVAGLLASLDHVGRVVVRRTPGVDVGLVARWIAKARTAFLDRYREVLATAGRSALLDESLLRPLLVAQECREYLYAVEHLPHWTYVPDAALPALLDEE